MPFSPCSRGWQSLDPACRAVASDGVPRGRFRSWEVPPASEKASPPRTHGAPPDAGKVTCGGRFVRCHRQDRFSTGDGEKAGAISLYPVFIAKNRWRHRPSWRNLSALTNPRLLRTCSACTAECRLVPVVVWISSGVTPSARCANSMILGWSVPYTTYRAVAVLGAPAKARSLVMNRVPKTARSVLILIPAYWPCP